MWHFLETVGYAKEKTSGWETFNIVEDKAIVIIFPQQPQCDHNTQRGTLSQDDKEQLTYHVPYWSVLLTTTWPCLTP